MVDLKEVKETLKKDPNNPSALAAVAKYYLNEGNFKEANDYFRQVLQLDPHCYPRLLLDYEQKISKDPASPGLRLSLAGLYLFNGELDQAILELEEILELEAKSIEAYNLLGKIYVKQEKTDEAIALLEKSLQEGVKDVSLIEILAAAYLEKERLVPAIKLYEEILQHRPNDKQTLRVLAELYTRVGDYLQAAKSYQAMFSDDPEVSREVIHRLEELLKKLEGNILIREILADIYMRSLNPEAAVLKLQEIYRLDQTKLKEVIAKLKSILKIYPGQAEASLALAEAFRREGSYSEAVETYHDLAKIKPEFLSEIIAGYKEVLAFCPEQVLARTYLAEAYLYNNQVDLALVEFEKILAADSSMAEIVSHKCKEIIKSQPALLQAKLVLGQAQLNLGEFKLAAALAEEIIAQDKKFSGAYLLLGEANFKLKLCSKALLVLSQALAMDPNNSAVQKKYQEVKEREVEAELAALKQKLAEDPWKVSLHLDLAKLYINRDLREEATRQLQLVLKDQARAHFAANLLGSLDRREGRFDLAAAQFSHALELAPPELKDFARTVRFNLGTTHEAMGDINKALKVYESILQEDIDFADLKKKVKYLRNTSLNCLRNKPLLAVISRFDRGEILALWGREAKASKRDKEEVSLSFGQKYNASGWEYFMKGMYQAALEEFQLAVQLDTKFSLGLNNLAVCLAKEGRLTEALTKLLEAAYLEPGSVVVHNNLGVVYLLLGQVEKAGQELEKAASLDDQLKAVSLNLADVYYWRREVERAIKLYRQVSNFDVLSEVAEARLRYKIPD